MRLRSTMFMALALLAAPLAAQAQADPVFQAVGTLVEDPATGNRYQLYEYVSGDRSWEKADLFAAMQSDLGTDGHLATITSQEENDFIAANFAHLVTGEVWLGGFQIPCEMPEVTPDCGWRWVTDEGPFGPQTPGGVSEGFVNWTPSNEPNNLGGFENHLGIFLNGVPTWNDEGNLSNIKEILVEFTGTVPATTCLELDDGENEETGGCIPSGVVLVQLENESILGDDDTVTQNLVQPGSGSGGPRPCSEEYFLDPRVDPATGRAIDIRSLDVFGELGGGAAGELILDRRTYGSPCFAVVKGEATFTVVESLPNGGTVAMTQLPDDLPGIGNVFNCTNPDLQQRVQATYQPDDRFRMFEESAAAVTNQCNSPSRKAGPEFSFVVLNTHEDCGPHITSRGPRAVFRCFERFANKKGNLLWHQLFLARPALVHPRFFKLRRPLNRALYALYYRQWNLAKFRLNQFLEEVENAEWDLDPTINGINHPGYLEMRTRNLIFRIEQLKEAQANLH